MIEIALIWSTLTHFEKMQDPVYIHKKIDKRTNDILAVLNNNFAIKTLVDKIV